MVLLKYKMASCLYHSIRALRFARFKIKLYLNRYLLHHFFFECLQITYFEFYALVHRHSVYCCIVLWRCVHLPLWNWWSELSKIKIHIFRRFFRLSVNAAENTHHESLGKLYFLVDNAQSFKSLYYNFCTQYLQHVIINWNRLSKVFSIDGKLLVCLEIEKMQDTQK